MNVEELIQLIRTCNLAQVRAELEALKKYPELYLIVERFYQGVASRKK